MPLISDSEMDDFDAAQNTVEDCMVLMTAKRVRHLPVLDKGQLVGVVTIGDVVKQVISEQLSAIEQLEKYIAGGY